MFCPLALTSKRIVNIIKEDYCRFANCDFPISYLLYMMFADLFMWSMGCLLYISPRYAVAFYYPKDSWHALKSVPWSGKYVFDDEIIRYISIENRKTNFPPIFADGQNSQDINKNEHGPSILVHTSVPFGIKYKEVDEALVYDMVLEHLNSVLPNLGEYQL